jgi:hypothetical protein
MFLCCIGLIKAYPLSRLIMVKFRIDDTPTMTSKVVQKFTTAYRGDVLDLTGYKVR